MLCGHNKVLRFVWPVAAAVWVSVIPAAAGDEEDRPDEAADTGAALRHLNDFGSEIRKLGDWSAQADNIDTYIDRIWDENGWNTESDTFARRLNHEIARIPPWQLRQRLNKLSIMVADRYRFSTGQRLRLQAKCYAESLGFIARNAEVISGHLREYVGSRISGKPLTPADVGRWTRESEPLVEDLLGRFDHVCEFMERGMNDEQRRLLEGDTETFRRHLGFFREQRAAWARGEWRPDNWGLENDPVQMGRGVRDDRERPQATSSPRRSTRELDPPARGRKSSERPPYRAEDESSWAQWVRVFISTYGLDAGQRDAIQSILAELETRAAQYRRQHTAQLEAVPTDQETTHKALAPIRDMFEELQARSRALLTETQRSTDKGE